MSKGKVYQNNIPVRRKPPRGYQGKVQIIELPPNFKLCRSRISPWKIVIKPDTSVKIDLETSSEQHNRKLLINAFKKLKTISDLKDDWNDNGAKHFENSLLVQCFSILSTLEEFPPEVFPVADGSIQFEYEKEDGSYLEFDIFENEISEYRVYPDGKEIEQIVDKNKISEEVKDFYEQSEK